LSGSSNVSDADSLPPSNNQPGRVAAPLTLRRALPAALLIAAAAGASFTLAIRNVSFWTHDEARCAQGGREQLRDGFSVKINVNGKWEHTKPPLVFYMVAVAGWITGGKINDINARIPSIIAAMATALIVYLFVAGLASRRAAVFSVFFFISNYLVSNAARSPSMDMSLTFTITAYLAAAFVVLQKAVPARRGNVLLVLAYAGLGAGILLKGIVAIVLPALVVLLYLVMRRGLGRFREPKPFIGLAVAALVAAPWFILAGWEFVQGFFWKHHAVRYLSAFDHARPLWYYPIQICATFGPHFIFLPAAVAAGFGRESRKQGGLRFFAAIWVVGVWGFFLLSAAKRDVYILPVYPALAILVGLMFEDYLSKERVPFGTLFKGSFLFMSVFLAAFAVVGSWFLYREWPQYFPEYLIYCTLTLIGSAVLAFAVFKDRRPLAVSTYFVVCLVLLFMWTGRIAVKMDYHHSSIKPDARRIAARVRDAELATMRPARPKLVFYLNRPKPIPCLADLDEFGRFKKVNESALRDFLSRPKPGYVLMRDKYFRRLPLELRMSVDITDATISDNRVMLLLEPKR